MGKNKKQSLKQEQAHNSQQYYFMLKPIMNKKHQLYYSDVIADFSPVEIVPGVFQPIVPIFNLDKKYWTKSFVSGFRKEYYFTNPLKAKQRYAQKYRIKTYHENLSSHTQLQSWPAPKPKSHYCHICEKEFNNYYHHIERESHKENGKKGAAYQYILELIQKQQKLKLKAKNKRKIKKFLQPKKQNANKRANNSKKNNRRITRSSKNWKRK